MEQAIPMAALNNPGKHFSYSRVEAGDITSLFLGTALRWKERLVQWVRLGAEVRAGLLA